MQRGLSNTSIIKILDKVTVLNRLSQGEKIALAGLCKEKRFEAGSSIFKQGDAPDGFYMIISGKAAVLVLDTNKQSQVEVGHVQEGDYFGETALLSDDTRTASVKASSELSALFLDRKSFESCFKDNSGVKFANRRIAVSAEVVQKDEAGGFAAKSSEMNKDIRDMLLEATSACPLFSNLDLKHRIAIVMSMFRVEVPAGKVLIKQGEQGSNLYVVEKGLFKVTCQDTKTHHVSQIATKGPKSVFGELALMYNSPRQATVTATLNSAVWVVDRYTYRRIAHDLGQEKLHQHKTFLRQCDVLTALSDFERSKIAEALEEVCFNVNTVVFEQGNAAEHMYFISKGEVEVQKDGKSVGKLAVGQYFGELALLNEDRRAATVVTTTNVECLKLDKQAVKLLLGDRKSVV